MRICQFDDLSDSSKPSRVILISSELEEAAAEGIELAPRLKGSVGIEVLPWLNELTGRCGGSAVTLESGILLSSLTVSIVSFALKGSLGTTLLLLVSSEPLANLLDDDCIEIARS